MDNNSFKKFLNSYKILLVHSQLFGLITFSYTETNFRPSNLRFIYNVLLSGCTLSLVACYLHMTMTQEIPIIYKAISVLYMGMYGIYLMTIWICSLINRHKVKEMLSMIIDFDIMLQTSCIIIDYGKSKRRMLIQLLGRYCVLMLPTSSYLGLYVINSNYDYSVIKQLN
ncbi:hypothetical protein BDFB_010029 [Asbolus verrucosus]|uniref:Uncharacterized protein n=1 Tax=Asbolus verrucosus TaxID=1661398 RepID=A0A482V970_ASBVE|nr:hypothetical protein BDFB_010029 [Asbolus verrucosus]